MPSPSHGGGDVPGPSPREQTDESLRVERDKADVRDADRQGAAAREADAVVKVARDRADHLLRTARDQEDQEDQACDSGSPPAAAPTGSTRSRADGQVVQERETADAVLAQERVERKHRLAQQLSIERETTDHDLTGEREGADLLSGDLREVNARMVAATLDAQEAAERADDSASELRAVAELRELFIGILGHDLRGPLAAIGMSAGRLLRRGRLDEEDAKTTARIVRAQLRMSRMITQLLELTHARLGGGFIIQPQPADLRDLCGNACAELERAVELEMEGDLAGTWDPDRLAEVLSNLLGNAAEHSAPTAAVKLRARAQGAEGLIEGINEGPPIPAELLPHIFEPFRRGQHYKPSPAGNLGLGLYISRQIVLAHGGALTAHSAGGMTTFTVRLPRASAGPSPELKARAAAQGSGAP